MSWLYGWSKRIKLTIDHERIDGDLTNFPVLMTLASEVGRNSMDVTNVFDELITVSGTKKIAVTTSDEETQCYVEIERWDWDNEKACLWVKVPTIVSGTDTDFYLYYDKDQSDNDLYVGDVGSTPARNVWDSNFKAVWHMSQDPTGGTNCIKDSTFNTNHGTPAGSMTSDDLVDGKVGKALDFDGSDDSIGETSIDVSGDFSVEWIIKPTSVSDYNQQMMAINGWGSFTVHTENDGGLYVGTDITKRFTPSDTGAGIYSVGNYDYVAYVYDGANGRVYENETLLCGPKAQDAPDAWGGFRISPGAHGIFDEIRVSNTNRSSAWIKTTYYSNWDNLMTFGAEEYTPAPLFYYEGYITVESTPAARIINLYKRDTGELMDSTTSSGSNGYFKLGSSYDDYHFVVALPDLSENYAILTDDKIHPTGGN